jgi:hypothetical protein
MINALPMKQREKAESHLYVAKHTDVHKCKYGSVLLAGTAL